MPLELLKSFCIFFYLELKENKKKKKKNIKGNTQIPNQTANEPSDQCEAVGMARTRVERR